jgi:hypothetical protein
MTDTIPPTALEPTIEGGRGLDEDAATIAMLRTELAQLRDDLDETRALAESRPAITADDALAFTLLDPEASLRVVLALRAHAEKAVKL